MAWILLPVSSQAAEVPRLLTVLEANAKPGDAVYDMGSLSLQMAAPQSHTFVLRNTTGVPLTLDHLQASCPCTTASVIGDAGAATPVVIAPNGTLSVRVSVDPLRLSPGLLHKSVWVFVQGQAAPAATLKMIGALLPAVTFMPPSLGFGHIEKGTELTLLLRVTPAPARLEPGTDLRLVSPDPDVQVSEVPQDAPAVGALPETAASAERVYRVHLIPHAHVGRLQGRLTLRLVHSGDPLEIRGTVVDTVAWRAEVAGDVTASPSIVAFGITTAGQTLTRRVRLTGKALGKDWKALAVSSTSPFLSAAIKPRAKSAEAPSDAPIDLDVRLDPHMPAGPLDARLTVTTPSGEQLVLPVFAVVPAGSPGVRPQ